MKFIYKYAFDGVGDSDLSLPIGAKILDVQIQDQLICLWAIIDTEVDIEKRTFRIVGSGWRFKDDEMNKMEYIATIQQGMFVWHVFEVK